MRILLVLLVCLSVRAFAQMDAVVQPYVYYTPEAAPYIEMYLSCNASTLVFNQVQEKKYQASLSVNITIFKEEKPFKQLAYLLKSILLSDTSDTNFNIVDVHRFALAPGHYSYTVSITDSAAATNSSALTGKVTINDTDNKPSLSELMLLRTYEWCDTGAFCKYGRYMIPQTSNFIDATNDKLVFFIEGNQFASHLATGAPILWQYKVSKIDETRKPVLAAGSKKDKAGNSLAWLQPIDISTLYSGSYELTVSVVDAQNKLLASSNYLFRRHKMPVVDSVVKQNSDNPFAAFTIADSIKEYIRAAWPITRDHEKIQAKALLKQDDITQLQNYMYGFWYARQQFAPLHGFISYQSKVMTVNKAFGTRLKKGYETDRGRVYLQYGAPNSIVDKVSDGINKPYQIWHYYTLNNQRDRKFVFIDNDYILNDYTLTHSNAVGEAVNKDWEELLRNASPSINTIEDELKTPH